MKKSLFLFAFLLLQLPFLQAQLSDDFSDGDFTNSPTWSGDVGEFQISTGNELQSNGPSGSATLHLSTPNTQFSNTKWEFLVKLDGFNPSTSNYAQVYLMSDASDLEGSLNGYVVRVGRTSDRIQLSKLIGTGFSTLVETADSYLVGNNTNVRIQVTRDALGNWSLKTDLAGGTNFTEIGTAFDDTFTNTSHFGVLVRHSSTRRNLFFFDDFLIELIPTIPTISLSGATASNSNQVLVIFSDTVDLATAETEANYSINNGIGAPTLAEVVGFNQVRLTLASSLSANNYELTANNVENKAKTATIPANSKASFAFTPPEINLVSASQFGQNGVRITFSDTVDLTTAETEANYFVNNGIGVPILAESTAFNQVLLTFTDASIKTGNYNLTVNNVQNKSKTATVSANSIASFDFVGVIGFRELVINEIFADPSPTIDLPDAEFVEIHNPTTSSINLKDATFSDASSSAIFPDYELASNSYLILCARSDTNSFKPFGATLGLSGFPSAISNSGELLQLKDAFGNVIDEVDFELSWYRDAVKNDGGYSLEIINPTNDSCFWGMQNWIASTDASGGTPGKINSVFDNTPDTQSPEITQVVTQSLDTIFVEFNEKLTNSTLVSANISISNGSETILVNQVVPLTPITFYLLIQPLTAGKLYELVFSNVEDCTGNPIGTNSSQIGLGRTPTFGELVISEIMADPEPQVGLPEVKYVEIHNTTSDLISMKDVAYSDNTKSALLPNQNIASGEYILLSSTSASVISALQPFGKVIGVSSFPEPNTTGDDLSLRNPNGELLHSVFYDDDWYRDDDKNDGGYSLEMIDTSLPCLGFENWTASDDNSGGTPGSQNSVFGNQPTDSNFEVTRVSLISPSSVTVTFNRNLSDTQLTTSNISIISGSETISVSQITQSSPNSFRLTTQPLSPDKAYEIAISSLTDCAGNTLEGNSTIIGIGRTPDFGDLIMSEIFADPTPQVGLPDGEFVELHNTTSFGLELSGVVLSDGGGSVNLPSYFLPANSYVILCNSADEQAFSQFGKTIPVSISLNVSGEQLILQNPSGEFLHRADFNTSWYRSDLKADGGYSLEIIDPNFPCKEAENWNGSANARGGTPGESSSVSGTLSDEMPPKISTAFAENSNTIILVFDEFLDAISATESNNFSIDNGVSVSQATFDLSNPNRVKLTVSPSLEIGTIYEVTSVDLEDCSGNFQSTSATVQVSPPDVADIGDLILNEVTPQAFSGGVRFVEIYNNSDKFINLQGWKIQKDTTFDSDILSEGILIIPPKTHFAFTENKFEILSDYTNAVMENVFEIAGIPAFGYNEDNGKISLINHLGVKFDSFRIREEYQFDLLRDTKGVSLERISFDAPTNEGDNWKSASSTSGFGTPGYLNSQNIDNPKNNVGDDCFSVFPEVFSPDNDGNRDFTTISYTCNQPNSTATIRIYDALGRLVKTLLQNRTISTEGFFQWDGTTDENEKARVGYYIVLIETFELGGGSNVVKKTVAIGGF
jgi:hypothetical protein